MVKSKTPSSLRSLAEEASCMEDEQELMQYADAWEADLKRVEAERDTLKSAAGLASSSVDEVARAIEAAFHITDHGHRASLIALEEERDAALIKERRNKQ